MSLTTDLPCDALLFDLDGVLIDSTAAILRIWQEWADSHGVDMQEIERVAHGLRSEETIRLVAPHLDAKVEAELFMQRELLDSVGVVAFEGALPLVSTLPEGAWAVVTSAREELVKIRMPIAGLPVPRMLVTADDVKEGKPSPEPYLAGAKKVGVAPERCLVVEDAPAGIQAAKAAGMRVVAVASTHSHDVLEMNGADMVLDKISDLRVQPGTGNWRLTASRGMD
ncbi:haloacid dehalogenase [Leptolinea sp. HRD-7]|nr:haloacid dehalogenase [Leptolinea sp. HRD-7]